MREILTSRVSASTPAVQEPRDSSSPTLAEPTPTETLNALVAEHGLQLEEWDTTTLDPKLRERFMAAWDQTEGDGRVIVVPSGQDPSERLHAVRALLAHPAVTA